MASGSNADHENNLDLFRYNFRIFDCLLFALVLTLTLGYFQDRHKDSVISPSLECN